MKRQRAIALLLFCTTLTGCTTTESDRSGPYSDVAPTVRSTAEAEALCKEAAELIESNPEAAEVLLRESLAADLFFGPAHNNLGVLFLEQGKLYEAANEFEWARKLMPGHPDPRFNLAMTLERAGQAEEAFASYTAALEVYEGFLPAIQGLARLSVRSGIRDERLEGWLRTISMRAESDSWKRWARKHLSLNDSSGIAPHRESSSR